MSARATLTADRLRQVLNYDPVTGTFTWAQGMGARAPAGSQAGCRSGRNSPWLVIRIDGVKYYAHRLAWLHIHGEWPVGVIDHVNGNPADNRIANLRDVPQRVNCENKRAPLANNQVGFLGVSPHGQKFAANICAHGESKYLGRFECAEEAHKAYVHAKRALHEGCVL